MTANAVTQTQYIETVTQASSWFASGLSETATRYTNWVTAQQAVRVVSETEKYAKFATEWGTKMQQAATNAAVWQQAARDAGNTGIANIMQKYATSFASTATNLLNQTLDARTTLNGIIADARLASQQASDLFGKGNFGRLIGPAFDAAQMIAGAVDWAVTGNSDKFGGAAMGVLLSAGAGIFAAGVLTAFGVPIIGVAIGAGLAAMFGASYGDSLFASFRDAISPTVNTSTKAFATYQPPAPPPPPPDPLVLDLDGGGVSTAYVNTSALIYFDMDADGIRTATGWIKPGEAIVVRDLNGNGIIDSGRELFGDQTILTRGPRAGWLAQNGFEAIADLDSNLDGKFDASDVAFNSVKLWRDANQNAVSEPGELATFGQLGVQGINTTYSSSFTTQDGQNWQIASGTFTWGLGQSGATGLAASFRLYNNPFYSDYINNPLLTAAAKGSAQMNGSGWLRDLREAMSMGTPAAAILQAKVNAFAAATTQVAQRAAVEDLILAWGETAARQLAGATRAPSAYDHNIYIEHTWGAEGPTGFGAIFGAALDARGFAWRSVPSYTSDKARLLGQMLVDAGLVRGVYVESHPGSSVLYLKTWTVNVAEAFESSDPATFAKIRALEAFNGEQMLDRFVVPNDTNSQGQAISWKVQAFGSPQLSLLDNAIAALKETIYAGLVTQTRLKPYLDSIGLVIDANGVRFDTAPALALVQAKAASSWSDAMRDVVDLQKYSFDSLRAMGWDVNYTLKSLVDSAPTPFPNDIGQLLSSSNITVMYPGSANVTTLLAFNKNDTSTVLGSSTANTITGNTRGRDLLYGMGGDDVLLANGNDPLNRAGDGDILDGGAGNDTLGVGASYRVNDAMFIGGTGNDTITARGERNTIVFNRGDGRDMITVESYSGVDSLLSLGVGIAPSDVAVSRAGSNLVLSMLGGSDTVTVNNWFVGSAYQFGKVNFADGTVWTNTQVTAMSAAASTITGTAGPDTLVGTASADQISGLAGNDTLTGGLGNDTLNGGTGFDTAIFSGLRASYTVTQADGKVAVSGADGVDVLTSIEKLIFSDKNVFVKAAVSDFNADGTSDLLWSRPGTGATTLWTLKNNVRVGNTDLGSIGATGAVQATGDFNGDGTADFIWKNTSTGQFNIWSYANGVQSGSTNLGTIGTQWNVMGSGDFNADGTADLVWRNSSTGQLYLWMMQNNAIGSSTDLGTIGVDWTVSAVGDFNADGTSDLGLRNTSTGQAYIWNFTNGAQSGGISLTTAVGTNWSIMGAGDFNADGTDDIAWRNSTDGTLYLWMLQNNAVSATSNLGVIGTAWTIDAISNVNADATSDLLLKNNATGQFYVWNITNGAVSGTADLGVVGVDWQINNSIRDEVDSVVAALDGFDKFDNFDLSSAAPFKTSDGKTLLDSQVQNLVSAMAAFAPPAAGQTTLPANYATTLAPVLAANWV